MFKNLLFKKGLLTNPSIFGGFSDHLLTKFKNILTKFKNILTKFKKVPKKQV